MPEEAVAAPRDGGWGWLVCLACFMTHLLTDGILYSIGIVFVELLEYYGEKTGNTAMIASLCFGICFLTGPINAAISNHFGSRKAVIFGTCIMTTNFVISMFAPNIYFLYVTFGIVGWGYGLVNQSSIVCLTKYFQKRRAFAMGLGVSGSGIGTFIFSPLTRALIDVYTWKGTLLIQSGLILNCIVCGLVYLPLDHPVNKSRTLGLGRFDDVDEGECMPLDINNDDDVQCYFDDIKLDEGISANIESGDNIKSHSGINIARCESSESNEEIGYLSQSNVSDGIKLYERCPLNIEKEDNLSTHTNRDTYLPLRVENEEHVQTSNVEDTDQSATDTLKSKIDNTSTHSEKCILSASDTKENIVFHNIDNNPKIRADTEDKAALCDTSLSLLSYERPKNCPVKALLQNESECNTDNIDPNGTDPHMDSEHPEKEQTNFVGDLLLVIRKSFDFKVLTNLRLLLFAVSLFTYGLGYYVPYVYLPVKALHSGIDRYRSAWLVSTIGIANTIGRVVFGFISDKKCVNRLVLFNTALILCGVGTVICPFFNVFGALVVYSAIYGLLSGVTICLMPVIIADLVGTEMLANAFGVTNFFIGISTFLGPPLSGWLFDITNSYVWTFVAAGIALILGGAMMYAAPLIRKR